MLIVFDDMIADLINNKKLNSIITELFIRRRKLSISLVFITKPFFKFPEDVRPNSTHFFILEIPNKRELQQIALNHSSGINSKDLSKIYNILIAEPYSFLVNDAKLASDNPLRFRKKPFLIYNKIMTIDDQITDEKLQYDINREAAEISDLSSNKIGKYEYFTGEEILPSNQRQIIEQAIFTYSPLGKAFEKQIKTIEDQGKKQVVAIQNQGQVETIKKYDYDNDDSPLISKQKEIFNKLVDKSPAKITELDEKS